MFDFCTRAFYYGVGAKIDDLKYRSLKRKTSKSETKIFAQKPKTKATQKTKEETVVNKTPESNTETKEKYSEQKKEQETVVPATVINNPSVERSISMETDAPIDIKNIKKHAKDIASEIEKSVKSDENQFAKKVVNGDTTEIVEVVSQTIEKNPLTRQEIIFKAFMEKPEEDQSFAIYDAIVKHGDDVLNVIDGKNGSNDAILYDIFIENVLGLKKEEVGTDGLDKLMSQYENFEDTFTKATFRALSYLRGEDDSENQNQNSEQPESVKVDLKDNIKENDDTVSLKMPIQFEDDETKDSPKPVNKSSNRRTNNRKK